MGRIKRVFKILFVWQDEEEEEWLREMSKKGWLLKSYNVLFYTFERHEPEDYIYRLDYKSSLMSDFYEYLKLFDDAGWEYVTRYFGWIYFRIPAKNCKTTHIYTDTQSKVEKYRGLLKVLTIILTAECFLGISLFLDRMKSNYSPIYNFRNLFSNWDVISSLMIVVITLLTYAVVKIVQKINNLKQDLR